MKILCLCHTCAKFHIMDFDPIVGPASGFSDWLVKHPQHDIDFEWPERSSKTAVPDNRFMDYLSNGNINIAYAAAAANTITIASLASSSTLLTGRQGTKVDNSSNKYLDYLISGKIKTASATTSTSIYVVCVAPQDYLSSTFTWPDAFGTNDAAVTVTSQAIFNSLCKFAANLTVDTATATYPFGQTSIGQIFGGTMPVGFQPAVFQNTGAALDSTTGNHEIVTQGVYVTY